MGEVRAQAPPWVHPSHPHAAAQPLALNTPRTAPKEPRRKRLPPPAQGGGGLGHLHRRPLSSTDGPSGVRHRRPAENPPNTLWEMAGSTARRPVS